MLNVQINSIHSGAVCQAIGERLALALRPQSTQLPPHLLALMQEFGKADGEVQPLSAI